MEPRSCRASFVFRWIVVLAVALSAGGATAQQEAVRQAPAQGVAPRVEFWPQLTAAEARLEEALETKVEFDFIEAPLQVVADYVRGKVQIPIIIDAKSLDESGLNSDTPVTIRLEGVPLKSALDLALRSIDLTAIFLSDVLLITTPEVADTHQITRIYPIGDLASNTSEFDWLSFAIQNTVHPVTWDKVGGPGAITYVPQARSMAILQVREAHDEILTFLRALRAASKNGPGKGTSQDD